MIVVRLAEAVLCMAATCFPVLVGANTRPGTYPIHILHTQQRGYGGDVLLYDRDATGWFAIHRTFPGRERMYDLPATQRRRITAGCINVQPNVYEALRGAHALRIEP